MIQGFIGDLARAETFFHHALGLDKVFQMPTALFLSAGGYHHHLGANTWAGDAPTPGEGDARLLEWTLVLPTSDDAESAVRSIEAAGFAVKRDHGEWLITDPWGTVFRISAEGPA